MAKLQSTSHLYKKASTALLAFTLMFSPIPALADTDCHNLQSEELELKRELPDLLAEYPATHIVIGICGYLAERTHQENGQGATAFVGCATTACAFLGFGNCVDVAKSWFDIAMRIDDLEKRRGRLDCE